MMWARLNFEPTIATSRHDNANAGHNRSQHLPAHRARQARHRARRSRYHIADASISLPVNRCLRWHLPTSSCAGQQQQQVWGRRPLLRGRPSGSCHPSQTRRASCTAVGQAHQSCSKDCSKSSCVPSCGTQAKQCHSACATAAEAASPHLQQPHLHDADTGGQ